MWLQPFPDALLADLPSGEEGPHEASVSKETFELTFLVAIQHLAPLPRAVLVLRDVLDLSARETAEILETTAVTNYVLAPGAGAYRPLAIDVLRMQDGLVREIVTFDGSLFAPFGLPATLPRSG